VPAVPERTYQATILQLRQPESIPVQRPVDAIPGAAASTCRCRARLAGELPGVRDFLQRYRYTCFEQQASIAIGLRDTGRWNRLMSALPDYLDRDGLVKFWTLMRDGDDSLTAYVLSVAAEAGWAIPERERARMEQALIGFVEGRVVRSSALADRGSVDPQDRGAGSAFRRAEPLNAKWLDSIALEPNLWPTSAVIDWYLILKRQPKLPRHDERIKATEQILRSRLNFQGTTMGFSTEKTDALWWLMISADSNANKLLLALNDVPAWKRTCRAWSADPSAACSAGHWNTTVANAWGVLALAKILRAVRSYAGDRNDGRNTRRSDGESCVAGRRWRQTVRAAPAVARRPPRPRIEAGRHRCAVGHAAKHCGDSADDGAVERLPDHAHRDTDPAANEGRVAARRHRACAARSRRAGRHGVGGRRRPAACGQHGARPGPGRRLDPRHARRAQRGYRVAGVRGADLRRVSCVLPLCTEGAASSSSTRCGSTIRVRSTCRRRGSRRCTRRKCSAKCRTPCGSVQP
jgi:hypothetical protein